MIHKVCDSMRVVNWMFRAWSEGAGALTRRRGQRVNLEKPPRQAYLIFFDGGVTDENNGEVKHKVGGGWLMQVAEQWQQLGEPQWQTVFEVCKALPNASSVSMAKLAAAEEAAYVVISLVTVGQITTFDLKG